MRAPRYKFPDEVRSATRTMASRMVRDGTIAYTPDQLDAWISQTPDVRETLQKGGYNKAFTSHDLLPLLQVFIVQAGGPPPPVDAPPRSSKRAWLLGIGVAVVLLAAAVILGILR